MKKILSVLLALSMLAVPVYANTGYTQEQLIARAKEILSIDNNYDDFEIRSSDETDGITRYYFQWTDTENNREVTVEITDTGEIYNYSYYDTEETDKSKIYSPREAMETGDNFLKKVLGNEYENIEFNSYNNGSDYYALYYNVLQNGVAYYDRDVSVSIDKHTNNVTSYSYPSDVKSITTNGFEGAKTLDEAEDFMKNNMVLGYKTDFNYGDKKYEVKLLYRMNDYFINAKDFSSLTFEELFTYGGGGGSAVYAASDSAALTPQETEGIEDYKNAISLDEALQILNTTLGLAYTEDDVTADYDKDYDRDEYSIRLESKSETNDWFCKIDAEGRITSYYMDYDDEGTGDIIAQGEAEKTANDILGSFHYGYERTPVNAVPVPQDTESYIFTSNVIRNGYVSFDEETEITIDNSGRLVSIWADYIPDDVFGGEININVTPEQAYSTAVEQYPLKPYHFIKFDYMTLMPAETTPVYGFEQQFSVDASTGELLDYYGDEIINNEVREYTDLDSQWYAEYAINLAYMGYAFDEDEFRGDDPLTYKGLQELNKSRYSVNIDLGEKDENDTITRYEFAEYLIDTMGIKDVNKYNEIYIKPFDDVAYQYTGTVAILKAMGVIDGDSFRGNDEITRGEACAMLYRTLVNE